MSEMNNEWAKCDNSIVELSTDSCCLLDYQGKRLDTGSDAISVMPIWRDPHSTHSLELVYYSENCRLQLPAVGRYRIQNIYALCEMLAFFDESNTQQPELPLREDNYNLLLLTSQDLGYWFTLMFLSNRSNIAFAQFCEFLRKKEAYWMVRYLLPHRCSPKKVLTLCKEYGFSYSYFRRIVNNFFGMTAKKKLLSWRVSQTVLDIIDGRDKITDIALQNGFASSSHASTTIKKELGLKPLAIRKFKDGSSD
ncbi:hypothetical protein BTJ39_03640 [Izhakiella australiensis]|uniref:HTH araC/xylS-type domain-containing protein n=1 Tax=Izhakiella australiensis TaxID=1926881 RepID=A0A1S8YR20_9GAMM|nr:helix-turn-helix domain-containing protein [Izhakiella australiensis]OON41073.1 hypothetical protein BTJ39_03640 [Izhakiella australiensis]